MPERGLWQKDDSKTLSPPSRRQLKKEVGKPSAHNEEQDEGSPMDFSFPLASSPPMQGRTFREQGESSRGTQGNNEIIEMLLSMQRKMEEREQRWNVQQQFRDNTYEVELKRRDQQLEDELQRREEKFETELRRKEQKFEK